MKKLIKCKWTKISIVAVMILFISFIIGMVTPFKFISLWGCSLIALALIPLSIYLVQKFSSLSKEAVKFAFCCAGIAALCSLLLYVLVIYNRNYEYLQDYTCYYDLNSELVSLFKKSPINGYAGILQSFWISDYSYFISSFLALPFSLTTGSHEAYVIIYYIFFIVPVIVIFNLIFAKIQTYINACNKYILFILGNTVLVLFPLLHAASILGQPDIFGLFFAGVIIMLLLDFDLYKLNWSKCIFIIFITLCLILTRRWYIFWLIGFYCSYAICNIIKTYVNDKMHGVKIILFNGIKLLLTAGISIGLIMSPFIYHTIKADYSTAYKSWYYGGIKYEIPNQIQYIGVSIFALVLIGLIYGLINKKLRFITIISTVGLVLSILCFTHVQNMHYHQSLLLMPYYIILLFNVAIGISSIKNRILCLIISIVFIAIFGVNMISSLTGISKNDHSFHAVTNILLKIDNADNHKSVWEFK